MKRQAVQEVEETVWSIRVSKARFGPSFWE